jgi:hypothetical protein
VQQMFQHPSYVIIQQKQRYMLNVIQRESSSIKFREMATQVT